MTSNDALDVIVRFHNVNRIPELDRCLFSLIGQSYRPLNIIVSVQRFDEIGLQRVRDHLQVMQVLEPDLTITVTNFEALEPADARSALVNAGFKAARGRYLAFLDYDDVTKPQGFKHLIDDIEATGASISFGKILVKSILVDNEILMTNTRTDTIIGAGLVSLFRDNFCPIHSFVIDRSKVDLADLYFEDNLSRHEDYDFLIRFCAKYQSSFGQKEYVVGDYSMKDDGSNTIMVPSSASEERWAEWRRSDAFVARRRETTLVSLRVQRQLGLPDTDPDLTVAALLAKASPKT